MLVPLLLALPCLVAAVPASTFPYVRKPATAAFAPLHSAPDPIPDNYIVVLKPETSLDTLNAHTTLIHSTSLRVNAALTNTTNVGVKRIYTETLKGYSGHFDQQTLSLIRATPEVDYVEHDSVVWASERQISAPWGLARLSHRTRLRLSTFKLYEYDDDGGEGVDAYIIDTGINIKHVSFGGRASWGTTIPTDDEDADGNGHGTHCAGTIASKDYGVAKKAKVIAVKVLRSNGSGSMSDVVAGVDWAAQSAKLKAMQTRNDEIRTGVSSRFKGSVANLSLGGGKSRTLDAAINGAVDGGLHVVVAAGNDNKDACGFSPAAAANAITVGASTLQDGRAYFSNWGSCVDVFAPGLNILSTWTGTAHATNTISGTSMASPHVAGLVAYFLSIYGHPTFAPRIPDDVEYLMPLVSAQTTLEPILASPSTSSNPTLSVLLSIVKAIFPASFFGANDVVGSIDSLAPIPKTITPEMMKKAIIKLSSPDLLNDVGKDSPNRLVYNNFTASAYVMDKFWADLE